MNDFTKQICRVALLSLSVSITMQAWGRRFPEPAPYAQVTLQGELSTRIVRNMQRLQEDKYQPQNVFLTEEQSLDWPGDTEGRTILALTLDAQASHQTPQYLTEIIRRIPAHLNELGYMGTPHPGQAHEQQLSGNGWMLRGLCEYYLWTKDESVRNIISSIARNLFLPLTDKFATYPIRPEDRVQGQGAEAGSIVASRDGWMLSTDVGCVFIGMEGLIHAYAVLGDEELRKPIETLIDRFLQVDLKGIKAQTHATLTACRGLMRYAALTGNKRYAEEAEKRFLLYIENGMTENYENYNWFDRFDTWTEPCAIVDSYMLAVQLWQQTMKPEYLEYAELIYYNGLCHTQRQNGGFGCDNCPGLAKHTTHLEVSVPEAHWCCTMRGGEGLSSVAHYACFSRGNEVWLPSYHAGTYALPLAKGELSFDVQTEYPFADRVLIKVKGNTSGNVKLRLAAPSWMQDITVKVNGKELRAAVKKGFVCIGRAFASGDTVEMTFAQRLRFQPTLNGANTESAWVRVFCGPLMLGCEQTADMKLPEHAKLEKSGCAEWRVQGTDMRLTPVWHLLSPKVWEGTGYSKQILFGSSATGTYHTPVR